MIIVKKKKKKKRNEVKKLTKGHNTESAMTAHLNIAESRN